MNLPDKLRKRAKDDRHRDIATAPLMNEAAEALDWFLSRRSAIEAKFGLHGPEDLASALRTQFKKIEN